MHGYRRSTDRDEKHQSRADYTLVETVSTRIPTTLVQIRGAAEGADLPPDLPAADEWLGRATGAIATNHRSSWVRLHHTATGGVYRKVYCYVTWRERLANLGRHTAPWAASRARREFDALRWLAAAGLPAAEPLAVFEARRFGFLTAAVLWTRAWPGTSLDRLLPTLAPGDRERLATALGTFVATLHDRGFRDRNLDLRNLLARPHGDGWELTKIDSPRCRIVRPGPADDALRAADWRRLLPQLASFGLAELTLRAAAASSPAAPRPQAPAPPPADRR